MDAKSLYGLTKGTLVKILETLEKKVREETEARCDDKYKKLLREAADSRHLITCNLCKEFNIIMTETRYKSNGLNIILVCNLCGLHSCEDHNEIYLLKNMVCDQCKETIWFISVCEQCLEHPLYCRECFNFYNY